MEHFLLLILGTSYVSGLHIEEGCEARSEWTLNYEWPEMSLSVWLEPTIKEMFTVEVEFQDHFLPLTYDSITVSRTEIRTDQIRDGRNKSVKNQTSWTVQNGWVDFNFTLNSHYNLEFNGLAITTEAVEHMPSKLTFRGSNMTVNCHSALRAWKINGIQTEIPLEGTNEHLLSFYSSKQFSPSLVLELRDISFGWNSGSLTTIPSKTHPLPPFAEHKMNINCFKKEDIICEIKIGENSLLVEELRVGNFPKAVTVKGDSRESFYVFLHKDHSLGTDEDESPDPETISSACRYIVAVIILAVVAAVLIAVLLVVFVVKRRVLNYNKEEKPEEARIRTTEGAKCEHDIASAIQTRKINHENELDVECETLLPSGHFSPTELDYKGNMQLFGAKRYLEKEPTQPFDLESQPPSMTSSSTDSGISEEDVGHGDEDQNLQV